jgi:hypothetical protein
LWLRFDKLADVPRSVTHRLSVSVDNFTEPVTSELAEAAIEEVRLTVDPPLRGGPWFAGNGPDNTSAHRRVFVPSEGVPFVYREYRRIAAPPATPPTDPPTELVRGELPLLGDVVMFK